MLHPADPMAATNPLPTVFWAIVLLGLALAYFVARTRHPASKPWPFARTACWCAGLLIAGFALLGPPAMFGHRDFGQHMRGHLLLGMLAPIFLVLGAPVTNLLRALPVARGRRVVSWLSRPPWRWFAHPVPAAILMVGGLALLYLTPLYALQHRQPVIAILVHAHLALAGFAFTAAVLCVDPVARRAGWLTRAAVLVTALGLHAALAKYLFAHPPAGVPLAQAAYASQLMYYGGDAVDLLLIVLFCGRWYTATAPRSRAVPPARSGSIQVGAAETP